VVRIVRIPYPMRMPPGLAQELDAFAARTVRNRAQATRELVSMTLRLGLGSVLEPPTMEDRAKGGKGRPASNPGAGSRSEPQFTAH